MKKTHYKVDSLIFWIVIVLLILGIVMVYSASSFKADEEFGDSRFYLKRHALKVVVGFALMLLIARINYRFWLKISPLLLVFSLGLLLYLLVSPAIEPIRGSRRWLQFSSLQFQPSDLARMSLVLFMSATAGRLLFKRVSSGGQLLFCLAALVMILVPIALQPDLGTAALTACIGIGIVFISGQKLRYLFMLTITAVPVAVMMLIRSGYQQARVLQYLESLRGEELSWQTKQSLVALGNGGFFGLGLGGSKQKYHFLPDPYTDFIYAIVGEELGILGTTLVLLLILGLVWRGLDIAMKAPDRSGKILGVGLVLNIAVYAFANAGVVLNLVPTTGIPMPLLSYGGTALVVNLFGVGVLLNIANEVRNQRLLYPVKGALERSSERRAHPRRFFPSLTKSRRRRDAREGRDGMIGYSVVSALRQMEVRPY